MKLLSAEAWGYIGILDGLGLYKINIDFTKCKHRLIIIRGNNGSGKSTLFGLLNPLPDSSSSFIPKREAGKILVYQDCDIIYTIKFISPVNDNGDRLTTKGYISKTIAGESIQLNDNGNISGCKEIIYSEFKLDANYVALSQLSSDDRGLVDKKPAERKVFVGSIINTLEVFNNICKTMTKRSSVFKSMVNSLTSKIDSIGDEKKLELTLLSLEDRIRNLSENKEKCIESSAKAKSTIEILDPGLAIQSEYNDIIKSIQEIDNSNSRIKFIITGIMSKHDIKAVDEVSDKFDALLKVKSALDLQIQLKEANINNTLASRQQESEQLETKLIKLRSYSSDCDIESTKYYISLYTDNINRCLEVFDTIGILDNDLTKDDYLIGLETLRSIKEIVDIFRSSFDHEILVDTLLHYLDKYPDQQTLLNKIESDRSILRDLQKEYDRYSLMADTLSLRPKSCKIDSCQYIASAVNFNNVTWKKMEVEIISLENSIKEKTIIFTKQQDIVECLNYINKIFRYIDGNKHILCKLPNGNIYSNTSEFINRLINNDSFDDINKIYSYIDRANTFEEYSIYKNNLSIMNEQYKVYESKAEIIEEITSDIDELNVRLSGLAESVQKDQEDILKIKSDLSNIISIESDYRVMIDNIAVFNSNNSRAIELNKRSSSIKDSIDKIRSCIDIVNTYNDDINRINSELNPLMADRDKIVHGISLVKGYKEELKEFQSKYDKIETIKRYSSPSKGIQTLFMEIYMNKVIVMANELLSLLFEGKYSLLKFIINDSEFSIPCIGDGLIHDDVSNMSTSQVCMMSMVLSFALLFQSSTKYNILKLDEIDGGLDAYNRLQFTNLLYQEMDMLGCEQCIIISHNTESSTADSDVIVLKVPDEEIIEGNIIYRY